MLFEPRHPAISQRSSVMQTGWNWNSADLNPLHYSASGLTYLWCHLEKHHKLQPKLKTTDELKAALQTILKSCHKNTLTRRWRNSSSDAWQPTWLWLPMAPGYDPNYYSQLELRTTAIMFAAKINIGDVWLHGRI